MQTISAQEFQKRYGKEAFNNFTPPKEVQKSLFNKVASGVVEGIGTADPLATVKTIGSNAKAGVNKVVEGFKQTQEGANTGDVQKMGRGVLNEAGGAIETAFSPISGVLQDTAKLPGVSDALSAVKKYIINPSADKISDIKPLQDFMRNNPNADEVVGNLINIALTVAGGAKAGEIKSTVGGAVDTGVTALKGATEGVASKVGNVVKGAEDLVGNIKEKLPGGAPVTPEIRLNQAIKDATPDYEAASSGQRQKLLSRVEEGGTFNGRTVKPNKLEIEAGAELSKVPNYDPNATKLAKYQLAEKENVSRAQKLDSDIKAEKIIVPKKQVASMVRQSIESLPEESMLLQKSDPAISNYMRVVENGLNKVDGTLQGVLELRKSLDTTYKNARGKAAFGSDKIAALDDIHTAARDTLTQYLIDNAKNVDVKAALRAQWNLYRAMDQLRVAAEKESGSSIGRLMQKFPRATKVVEKGIQAVGLGGTIGLIK